MTTIKRSVITRGITQFTLSTQHNTQHIPQNGDVAVFEVLSIGKHKSIQAIDETATALHPGDQILATFGGRYASNQFEGYLPETVQDTYQILGQGGVVGVLQSMHAKFTNIGATEVRLVGYATDAHDRIINTRYHNLAQVPFAAYQPADCEVYLSVGASMDSGKTTTAAYLARGAMLSGKRVAYIKLTGTVFSKDRRVVRDSGAAVAVDFSHCGYPSTFQCDTDEVLDIYATLMTRVATENPDMVIVEIADGLLQQETANLLQHPALMRQVSGVVLSCPDSLSVKGGLQTLADMHITPIMLSGLFTASPLMVKEVVEFTQTPIFTLEKFVADGALAQVLPAGVRTADIAPIKIAA